MASVELPRFQDWLCVSEKLHSTCTDWRISHLKNIDVNGQVGYDWRGCR